MKELERFKTELKHIPEDFTKVELQMDKRNEYAVQYVDGKPAGGNASSLAELYVRACGDCGSGSLYTQKTDRTLDEMLDDIRAMAKFSQNTEPFIINEKNSQEEERLLPVESICRDEVLWEHLDKAAKMIGGVSDKIIYFQLQLSRVIKSREVINSAGFCQSQEDISYELTGNISAEYNGMVTVNIDISAASIDELSVEETAEEIKRRIECNLPVVSCDSNEMECLLTPRFVAMTFCCGWKSFAGDYYNNGISALSGRLGEKIFSEALSIRDCCTSKQNGFRFALDCEGTVCAETELVRNGVFCGLLHNLESAEKAGAVSTGNAGRKPGLSGNVQTDIVVTPKNFTILPGRRSSEEIIADIESGVYVIECFDEYHSLDVTSGDFSIPGEGVLIEKGKLTGRIVNISIEGNLKELLADVMEASNETFSLPLPDVRSFLLTAPALRVKKLRISV